MAFLCQASCKSIYLLLAVGLCVTVEGNGRAEPMRSAASMPSELRAAFLAAGQNEAGPEYSYSERSRSGARAFRALNSAHGFSVEPTAAGVEIARPSGAVTLRLSAWGCSDRLVAYRSQAPRRAYGDPNRIEYLGEEPQASVVEWYKNGPLGLEQGFEVAAPPKCKPAEADRLRLAVAVRGATSLRQGAGRVELALGPTSEKLIYSDLVAQDAGGRRLPSDMKVEGAQIVLTIDTHGARYPLSIDPLVWLQQAKLTASDGTANQAVGYAVAIDTDTAVVGAIAGKGSAYVFVRPPGGGSWTQQAKLTASDGAVGDRFGCAVAIFTDTIVVGAEYAGAAYVFVRPTGGTTWTQQAKLGGGGLGAGNFGGTVSVFQDTVAVGAAGATVGPFMSIGAAYVYVRPSGGTTWSQQAQLTASIHNTRDGFGGAVSVYMDTLLIGAGASGGATGAGYVFVRPTGGTTWSQQAAFSANDAAVGNGFGGSVSLVADTALLGSSGAPLAGATGAGAAYVFVRPSGGTTWSQQAKLTASDGAASDALGWSVSLSGNQAVVGAYTASPSGMTQRGAAYVYARPSGGTTWSQQAKLTASDGAVGDFFGNSVSMSGNTVVVGAPQFGSSIGKAYVFQLGSSNGGACTTSSPCASGFCVDGVCCNAACAGGTTDCQACSQAAGAPADGTCAPLAAGVMCGGGANASQCIAGGTCDGVAATCNLTPAPSTVTCDPSGDPSQCVAAYQCDGKTAGSCPTTNPIPLRSSGSCGVDMAAGSDASDGSSPTGCQCQLGTQSSPPVLSALALLFLSGWLLRRRYVHAVKAQR